MASASSDERQIWDRHWRRLQGGATLVGMLASWVRRRLLQPAVRHYTDRWLPAAGVLVEAGCGTGEASAAIARGKRRLVGIDLSLTVLVEARHGHPYDLRVVADLRTLPFGDGRLAGAWNLGVLEHFPANDGIALLRELRRALAPGGTLLLFWPPTFGLSRWVLLPFELVRSLAARRRFRFFPDEVNRLTSRRHGRAVLDAAGFAPLLATFSPRDGFNHLVLVGRRIG